MNNKSLITNSIALAALALGINFSASVQAAYPTSSYFAWGEKSEATSDQELAKQIRDKISSGYFSKGYDQVNVEVQNGNVTLSGTVKTTSDKDKVEKEVRNLKGVKSLTSKISAQEPTANDRPREFSQDTFTTSADDQLNRKIRDNVSKGWLWDNYKDVSLNSNNGVVTLEGSVGSIKDQQKLMTEIQKIEGVKSVKSNLHIEQ